MLGINTNFASLNAQRNLSANGSTLQTSIERLSSGLRVNSAKDDAAGLAIAERMNAQVKGFSVASRNANDGISLAQVADGALGKISDRTNLNREYSELASEVERVSTGTKFNGNDVFSSANKSVTLQIGAANATTDTLTVNLTDDGTSGGNDLQTTLGTASSFGDITSSANATTAITTLDTAIDNVTNMRATVGGSLSRLDQVVSNLDTQSTAISTARGRIVDADFAKETAALTRSQILQQAGTAMLAQANQLPNNVLSLLR